MSQITAELDSGLSVRLSNGRHSWAADEPVDAGGTDTGPNPYELLLSSLAACTCLTIAMYCRHKGMTLNSIHASYEFGNIHADDCESCGEETKGFIEHIASNIRISGDFDDAQRKRLAQIVTRCPVHKTLANGVAFTDNTTFD
jgi:putative redox protein